MTLVIVVGTGIRLETGWTNVCCCTVMLPLEVAAMACICWVTQAVAAPMPRTGSVWLDKVCLVPNWVSRRMVAWIRLGSICLIRARNAGSNLPVFWAEPGAGRRCLSRTGLREDGDGRAHDGRGGEDGTATRASWTRYGIGVHVLNQDLVVVVVKTCHLRPFRAHRVIAQSWPCEADRDEPAGSGTP